MSITIVADEERNPTQTPKPTYEELELKCDQQLIQLTRLQELLNEHEKLQHYHRGYGTLADQMRDCLNWYKRRQEQIIAGAKRLNDDMIVYLRALVLCAEMAGNGSTHSEKAARQRGLVSQIETTIQKLRDTSFKFDFDYYYSAPDVWRSDYPVRNYIERNNELQRELDETKAQLAKALGSQVATTTADYNEDIPF